MRLTTAPVKFLHLVPGKADYYPVMLIFLSGKSSVTFALELAECVNIAPLVWISMGASQLSIDSLRRS